MRKSTNQDVYVLEEIATSGYSFSITKAEISGDDRTDAVTLVSNNTVAVDFSNDPVWGGWRRNLDVCIKAQYDDYPSIFVEECFWVFIYECLQAKIQSDYPSNFQVSATSNQYIEVNEMHTLTYEFAYDTDFK